MPTSVTPLVPITQLRAAELHDVKVQLLNHDVHRMHHGKSLPVRSTLVPIAGMQNAVGTAVYMPVSSAPLNF